jgi:hypothetical protein
MTWKLRARGKDGKTFSILADTQDTVVELYRNQRSLGRTVEIEDTDGVAIEKSAFGLRDDE